MRRVSILAVLITALFPAFLVAQGSDTALLRGTLTDASGAVVPNVTVTMTNVATGVSEKRTTDSGGRYLFTDLKPATYRATVEAAGFKTLIRDNIVLRSEEHTSELQSRLHLV